MTTVLTTTETANGNSSLSAARTAKNDEFYTRLEDIENELKHYRGHFRDKVVLLNCDDPEWSNFWRYFELNFEFLGLKKLIATHYTGLGSKNAPPSYKLEIVRGRDLNQDGRIDGHDLVRTELEGDGDFRSAECVALLEEADIVVTNPPFSLFREYVAQLMEHGKKFVIVGNMNAVTYKEVWSQIQAGNLWIGAMPSFMGFRVPADSEPRETRYWQDDDGQKWRSLGNACWFTNLDHDRRHEEVPLFRSYTPDEHPAYDHYDAINVDKVADIPLDYDGLMGVPITFLGKHNPEQFEIVDANDCRKAGVNPKPHGLIKDKEAAINGKPKYVRIVIRRTEIQAA